MSERMIDHEQRDTCGREAISHWLQAWYLTGIRGTTLHLDSKSNVIVVNLGVKHRICKIGGRLV